MWNVGNTLSLAPCVATCQCVSMHACYMRVQCMRRMGNSVYPCLLAVDAWNRVHVHASLKVQLYTVQLL